MKTAAFIILKILLFIVWCSVGLITLTGIKLSGFTIGSWHVSAEQVQMFVTTASDYLFWVWIVIGVFIIFRKWIKK